MTSYLYSLSLSLSLSLLFSHSVYVFFNPLPLTFSTSFQFFQPLFSTFSFFFRFFFFTSLLTTFFFLPLYDSFSCSYLSTFNFLSCLSSLSHIPATIHLSLSLFRNSIHFLLFFFLNLYKSSSEIIIKFLLDSNFIFSIAFRCSGSGFDSRCENEVCWMWDNGL